MNLYSDLTRILKENGCTLLRQKGSHEIWKSPITGKAFTVPHNCDKRHTANGILEDAGLPKQF